MDTAVGLVQSYLRVNGYFTVSEYPIVELREDFQAASDVDILAFRFPGAERLIPDGEGRGRARRSLFVTDLRLRAPSDRPDMIVGEVKEGLAEFNRSGRRPEVLAAALARFGCFRLEGAERLVDELLHEGRVVAPHGHVIRLVAFGSHRGWGRPAVPVPPARARDAIPGGVAEGALGGATPHATQGPGAGVPGGSGQGAGGS